MPGEDWPDRVRHERYGGLGTAAGRAGSPSDAGRYRGCVTNHDVHLVPSLGGEGGRFRHMAEKPLQQGQPFTYGNVIYQVTGILPNAEGYDRVVQAVRVSHPAYFRA